MNMKRGIMRWLRKNSHIDKTDVSDEALYASTQDDLLKLVGLKESASHSAEAMVLSKEGLRPIRSHEIDFNPMLEQIGKLGPRAQATFCFRLMELLPLGVVKTCRSYATQRLDHAKDHDGGQEVRPGGGSTPRKRKGAG